MDKSVIIEEKVIKELEKIIALYGPEVDFFVNDKGKFQIMPIVIGSWGGFFKWYVVWGKQWHKCPVECAFNWLKHFKDWKNCKKESV